MTFLNVSGLNTVDLGKKQQQEYACYLCKKLHECKHWLRFYDGIPGRDRQHFQGETIFFSSHFMLTHCRQITESRYLQLKIKPSIKDNSLRVKQH